MTNYLICFRNDNLEVTHRIYVRASDPHKIRSAAKQYFNLDPTLDSDYMDYGQSRKKGIPLITIGI